MFGSKERLGYMANPSVQQTRSQIASGIPTDLQMNLCLRNVSNLLDLEYILFENAVSIQNV